MKALAILATAVGGFALAGNALAGTAPARIVHDASSSSNWAGYAVTGSSFTDVKGTWVQPAVACTDGPETFAAFWVGLGGFAGNGGLEQTGTEADCRAGAPSYSAWYELLPDASVTVPLAISPGDTISAEVSVAGPVVTLTLTNVTSGQTFTTQASPNLLDTTSAEWIAEAPSQCFRTSCLTLPLANFGTVQFSGSTTTANGHVGTISDGNWSATQIQLGGHAGSAVPAGLAPDGSAFSVTVAQPQAPQVRLRLKERPKHKRHPV